jgi:hypothetical protein
VPLALTSLRPYKSLLVSSIPGGTSIRGFLQGLVGELRDLVRSLPVTAAIADPSRPVLGGGVQAIFFNYTEDRQAAWTTDPSIVDKLNHLVLVCGRGKHVAMVFSDNRIRDRVFRRIDSRDGSFTGKLSAVSAGVLNAAFVRGETHTLWLSGAHRRVLSKADNKILSGRDLQFALDPLGDQSYFFTAARSRFTDAKLDTPIGVTPRRSRLWAGATPDWDDFCRGVSRLLELIENVVKPSRTPLPVLAVPTLDATDLQGIKGPYDAALIPPELLDPTADQDTREEAEKWNRLAFEIMASTGPNFTAELAFMDANGTRREVGSFTFEFDLSQPERPRWSVTRGSPKGDDSDDVEGALNRRHSWLKVWYDSGHTLADEGIIVLRYRDDPFDGYLWESFDGFHIGQEKPEPLSADTVGTQGSLFCWVKTHWPTQAVNGHGPRGWLACDDGAMEIADFIHLDTGTTPPTIALIHVKASKSREAPRPISVSDYEVVTGQAVKNLRYLDSIVLSDGLAKGLSKRIGKLAWLNGSRARREDLVAALGEVGSNYQRVVAIVQPRATKQGVAEARAKQKSQASARLRQLDTLLLGARANCQGLGAKLYVVGEDCQ